MGPLRFSFVLHLHQPVGNFDFVFREHADDVYRPFLDFLEERALWPIGLHVSGPLIEWLGDHDSRLHDRIGRLAADGHVELLSAGWYEPILASLSPADRATQLGWMQDELRERFGVRPTGLWLTERVWKPELAADLARAGIEYALVDDHLARRAGVEGATLLGPMRAEWKGAGIDVLAIDEALRYLIPFRPAEEIARDLRRRHRAGEPVALFGDDGEKFGGWPRTREWLYDQGWLEAFGDEMDQLRSEGVVRWVTPATVRAESGPGPTVDLPEGSYPEMDDWAGGPWTNFLDRYEEAGRMHRRMTVLSDLCRAAGDPEPIRRAVGRGQCNDPYWHGVFGGVYMKHLREGVRGQLTLAERRLREGEALRWERTATRRGDPAWWAHSARVSCLIESASGGRITQLVWLESGTDVTDVLTRRHESYYDEAVARGAELRSGKLEREQGSASIHEIEDSAVLDGFPPVDLEPRSLVAERVLGADLTLARYSAAEYQPLWRTGDAAVSDPTESPEGTLTWESRSGEGPAVTRWIRLTEDALQIEWLWDPRAFPATAVFAPELSLGCPVELTLDPPTDMWRYPIVTVSKCPTGFEETHQGDSATPRWPVATGRARVTIRPPGAPSPASGSALPG